MGVWEPAELTWALEFTTAECPKLPVKKTGVQDKEANSVQLGL